MTRLLILSVSIILHLLTPGWILTDLLMVFDWIMIFFALISLILYRFYGKSKLVNILSFLLSVNSLFFCITTVKIVTSEIGNERALYRLSVLLNKGIDVPINFSRMWETINALQVGFSVVIMIFLGLKYLRNRFVTY